MKPTTCVVALSAAALLLSACAGGSAETSGDDPSGAATLRVACAPAIEHLPRHLAGTEGMFAKAGVSPECVQVATGPEQAAALLSGELDVALMDPANLAPLLDKGQPLAAFGMLRDRNYWDILVREGYSLPHADDGWRGTMKDLAGARIGVVARGAAGESVARGLFAKAGVDPNSVTFIATGLPTTTLAALEADTIDAAFTFEPGITLAESQGIAAQPFSLQERTGPAELDYADLLMVTSREHAASHRAELCRFTTAWDQGLEYVHDPANREAVDAAAAAFFKLPQETARDLVDRNLPFLPDSTALRPEQVDPAFAFLAESGQAKKAYQTDAIAVEVC